MKELQQLREYKTLWENDPDDALKFKNVIAPKEISYQLGTFLRYVSNTPSLFGGKDKRDAFDMYPAFFPLKRLPDISTSLSHCEVSIEEVDFEAVLDEESKTIPRSWMKSSSSIVTPTSVRIATPWPTWSSPSNGPSRVVFLFVCCSNGFWVSLETPKDTPS